ncbi:MAG: SAM-dependent methyltransferase, partial [Methanococcaceae archaeon]
CYQMPEISRDIDRVLRKYYYDVVGLYWSHKIKMVNERYKSIFFPFHEIIPPEFYSEQIWDLNEVIGYLRSWSSTQNYIELNKEDPINKILNDLEEGWGNYNLKRLVRWHLFFRVGNL